MRSLNIIEEQTIFKDFSEMTDIRDSIGVALEDPKVSYDDYLSTDALFGDKPTPDTWSDYYLERITTRYWK